jgi:4-carboxymuconolactone decarboxylase
MAPQRSDKFQFGMAIRRAVHGAEHVDRAWAAAEGDLYASALQEYVTEAAWGAVWARPGLDRKTRSLVVLAQLIALNRPHELETHIRSGVLRNGCTREEVLEIVLQSAAYCGIPAAVDAFRLAERVFGEIDAVGEGSMRPSPRTASPRRSRQPNASRTSDRPPQPAASGGRQPASIAER